MAILVLGGAGYIGSHTALELVKAGNEVVIADNLVTGYRKAIPEGAKFYEGDLRDFDFLNKLFQQEKIDAVIHFAAYSLVGESVTNPLKYYDNNLYGTNTITPIARKNGNVYECDLVLRNNITTEERPLGVYHPNPSLHHIKKENIGLIEVMGLAVLPARLAKEINMLETAMLNKENLYNYPELTQHAEWAENILKRYPDFSKENARAILEQEIGKVFLEVLEDAGVFKRNENGQKAFKEFITSINE